MGPRNDRFFTYKYWRRFFVKAIMYTIILSFIATLFVIIAFPVALAVLYSGWFLFLYPVYVILFFIAAAITRSLR